MQTHADTVKTNENDHYLITRDYYNNLITSNDPPIAEIGMLVNILPKGGDIHHHFIGAIHAETLLDYVKKEGFCIDPNSYQILKKPTKTSMTVDELRADIPKYNQLLSVWSTANFSNHSREQLAPDERFFDCFNYFCFLEDYIIQDGLMDLKKRAEAENVQYIETIFPFAPISTNVALDDINKLTSNTDDLTINQVLEKAMLLLEQDKVIQQDITYYSTMVTDKSRDIDDERFTMRFQPYVFRGNKPSLVFSGLYSAFSLAQNNRKIVGVNIVGAEHLVVAINDYTLHMKMFRFLKQKFPNVKLSLHAGELALGQVPPEGLRHHIRDAILIADADRIGHGVDIMHESNPYQLISTLLEKNALIEINLTSNEFILGIAGDNHPIKLYMRYGIPIAICTDDAGVSRNNLTQEYLLFISRYKPSYDQLKQVVYNSIKYSFLTEEEKKKQLNLLDKKFVLFEESIASRPVKSLEYNNYYI
ncbi:MULTISPECIES: adenosine deaminase family protein [unclassified Candidatus Tisiphia]|uniref:adenosine deaminase family protein n=1 Tax=unclassified Candidatus Tisiphia TaxID=2996318 RepID=UPI00312C83D5